MSYASDGGENFNERAVVELNCTFCHTSLTLRGMKANLVADNSVELFSTDCPILGNVILVGNVYSASICNCNLSDIACIGCGNVVGYHVTMPCQDCLSSCNNGNFWMFLSESSYEKEQFDHPGSDIVTWEHLKNDYFDAQNKKDSTQEDIDEKYLR